jgi:hypothetical protein
MKKTAYIKPEMQVVEIQQTQMLCGSPLTKSIDNSDFSLDPDGLDHVDVLPKGHVIVKYVYTI